MRAFFFVEFSGMQSVYNYFFVISAADRYKKFIIIYFHLSLFYKEIYINILIEMLRLLLLLFV